MRQNLCIALKPIGMAFAAIMLALPISAVAGPFGLERGMTLSDLGEYTESIVPGKYILETVPNPNPAFEEYIVEIGPDTGLCWIKAIGETITTNPYGAELKTEFSKLQKIVESIYGLHKLIDGVVLGSRWEDPAEWMLGLVNEERLLAAFWDPQSGSTLPDGMATIDLVASPSSRDSGYIAIEYSFDNSMKCKTELMVAAENTQP